MKTKNKYTTKQAIVAILMASVALINFLTLLFAIVSAEEMHLVEATEYHFANGFTLAFGECPVVIDAYQHWLFFYSMLHFVLSLLLIAALALHALLKPGKPFGKLGGFSCFMAVLMSLIYMITGLAANSVASEYASLYYDNYTLAYIPFILIVTLVLAIILVKWNVSDDFVFDFVKKREKKASKKKKK